MTFTPFALLDCSFYEPWPNKLMQWVCRQQVINQSLICSKYLTVAYKFEPFRHYGVFGVLRGPEPSAVGGLAHWIQTVYGESSSSDDTMWAACSSQNTNLSRESEKGEKLSLSQGQSSKHSCCVEREHLCFAKLLAWSSLITAGAIFGFGQISRCC